MRTFLCFVTSEDKAPPTSSLILAGTEERARELARRELLDARRPFTVELREGGKRLWLERVEAMASATAGVRRNLGLMRAWRNARRSLRTSVA